MECVGGNTTGRKVDSFRLLPGFDLIFKDCKLTAHLDLDGASIHGDSRSKSLPRFISFPYILSPVLNLKSGNSDGQN